MHAKQAALRSDGYRRLVASMPCIVCGKAGRSQACHMNGGGGATKHDDRLIFPACADEPGRRGCHMVHDQGGQIEKVERRRLEARYVLATVNALFVAERWPEDIELPDIPRLLEMAR